MPAMTRPIGYNPTQLPTGMPGEFDEEQADIQRRRQQMAALMEPAIGGPSTGLAGGIVNFLQGVGNQYERGQLDQREQALARRRADAADAWLSQMPQERSGVPEVAGTGPIAPPPGTPGVEPPPALAPAATGDPAILPDSNNMLPQAPEFVPNQAAQAPMIPSVRDMAAWAGRSAGLSSLHAKFAEKAFETAVSAPEKRALAEAAAKERAAQKQADRDAKAHEAELRAAERDAAREKDAADKMERQTAAAADREALRAAGAADRAELRAAIGAGGEKAKQNTGTSDKGNPVWTDPRTLSQFEIVNGKPVPYTGQVFKPGDEKQINAAMTSKAQQEYIDNLVARVKDPANEKAFGTKANLGSVLSTKTGGFVAPDVFTDLSDAHLQLRGEVTRNFADLIHQMYGSAYTTGEQARGALYTVQPGDKAPRIAQKLESQKAFLAEMDAKYGDKVRGAAAARTGGAAPGVDAGWGPVIKR